MGLQYHTNKAAASALAEELSERYGVPTHVCAADLANGDAARALVSSTAAALGEIDLLVNNAGRSVWGLLTDMSDAEWDRLLAVNLNSAFYLSRAVLPAMIARQSGCIVQITSMWGEVGASCEVAYSTTKAALTGFTRALAKEVGPSGVRVNAIAPGVIDTPMNARFDAAAKQALEEETPLCRLGTPEEVAAAVAFLASEQAAFITGPVLRVDGGMVIG